MLIRTRDVDTLRVGQAFLHTGGDVARTAVICRVAPDVVKQLSIEHDWPAQLESVAATGPGLDDEEKRRLNRDQNLLQAHRLRELVERVVGYLADTDSQTFQHFFTAVDKQGNPVPTVKPLLELTKAAESIHGMTYSALGDKPSADRLNEASTKTGDIALTVARALDRLIERTVPERSAIPVTREVFDV